MFGFSLATFSPELFSSAAIFAFHVSFFSAPVLAV